MLPQPCLAVVTDRTLLTPLWTLAQAIAPLVTGGANLVIFREVDLPDTPRLSVARFVADGVRGRVPWIAAGAPEFARKAKAGGVLLEENEPDIPAARAILGPEALIGVAPAALDAARLAARTDADFMLLNLDWSEPEKAISTLTAYLVLFTGPVIAGIDPATTDIPAILPTGASGVAICRPAMAGYDRTALARAYRGALESSG